MPNYNVANAAAYPSPRKSAIVHPAAVSLVSPLRRASFALVAKSAPPTTGQIWPRGRK